MTANTLLGMIAIVIVGILGVWCLIASEKFECDPSVDEGDQSQFETSGWDKYVYLEREREKDRERETERERQREGGWRRRRKFSFVRIFVPFFFSSFSIFIFFFES